jgi:hypothetical protein
MTAAIVLTEERARQPYSKIAPDMREKYSAKRMEFKD